jgi:hypothetical protein
MKIMKNGMKMSADQCGVMKINGEYQWRKIMAKCGEAKIIMAKIGERKANNQWQWRNQMAKWRKKMSK